jgi:CMP-N,N'-diacetyllegionaminic acid synthase
MYDGKRFLGLVVARGGSKGLPGKNIMDLGGRPLVAWSVAAGLGAKTLDRLIISTDDQAIAQAAREAGCDVPFIRPAHLATDEAGSAETVLHALDSLAEKFDYFVLLQATSPLRTSQDIDDAVALCLDHKASSCVSITETAKTPYWMVFLQDDQTLKPVIAPPAGVVRRQQLPKTYALNGAVYVINVEWFRQHLTFSDLHTIGYIMPSERSVDIDCLTDLLLARVLAGEKAGTP